MSLLYTLLFMFNLSQVTGAAAPAATLSAEEQLAEQIEAAYAKISDLTMDFQQTYLQKARGKLTAESGKFYVRRPKQLRWDYLAPRQKFFVYNGEMAYFYVVEDAQVIADKNFASGKLNRALGFLWGEGRLLKNFKVTACQKPEPAICQAGHSCACLNLRPVEPLPEVEEITLVVDKSSLLLNGALLKDAIGNETTYLFNEIKTDSGLTAEWFNFKIPAGVTLLEQGR